jgi:hypothetical protein
VHAGFPLRIRVEGNGNRANARPEFQRRHAALLEALASEDRTTADELLAGLAPESFLEEAYRDLDRYQYYRRWGTEAQQRDALGSVVDSQQSVNRLPHDLYVTALSALLVLDVKGRQYAAALYIWRRLSAVATEAQLGPLRPVIAEIEKLRAAGEPLRTPGTIGRGDYWFGRLFRRNFEIDVTSGMVHEIRLRCDKGFVFFSYQPGVRYRVEAREGGCSIQLTGTPGATFALIET